MRVTIITDSASDITQAEARRWGITVLPLKTRFGDTEYLDGVTMTHDQFYQRLVESDELPTTSQLSPFDYAEAFRRGAQDGAQVLCITLSSRLSGSYQSACIAAEELPGRVTVVDSRNVCVGQRVLVELALQLARAGERAEAIAARLEQERSRVRVIALLDTLEYLRRGGRISAASAVAGTLLSIKPVVAVEDGAVVVLGKARGSKNGGNMLNSLVEKSGGIDFSRPLCLGYAGLSDALLQKYIADSAPLYSGHPDPLPISCIGSTIGTHVGPGAIAAAFFAK